MNCKAKRCEFCNKEFIPGSGAGKICSSLLCLRRQRKRSQDRWNNKNKVKLQKYQAQWFLDNKNRLREVRRAHYLHNIERIRTRHRAYNRSGRRKLVEQRRVLRKPGIRLEESCLFYNFGTAKVDLQTKRMMAIAQLMRRVFGGKISSKQIPDKIKLIQKGETHHAYR